LARVNVLSTPMMKCPKRWNRTYISKEFVKDLDVSVDDLKGSKFVVSFVYRTDEEKGGIATVDDLVGMFIESDGQLLDGG